MIRQPENEENCTINVYLKNGESYTDKDIPEFPISENGMLVKFWHDDKLIVIPMPEVKHIQFCFNE